MKVLRGAKFDLSDVAVALFVVAITAMLLIPLPTALLDILLVVNISSSLLLLLVGLYMPNALALLAFPTLLLLSTLFRLSLNVASTRLILSQGDAGTVIQAFGTFLIRGEVVVGVIIFTIITIVNFIVIARGSARVSEVAARFALDSLPGKQMAIDSDLRSGLISPAEAEQKREELRKESQLFGSMDGAMKFVQGDAIAGFFIIFWNILGGLYQGIASGLSVAEAMQTYTILTVGDGLVSQIPALLVSICAGIVVTRVSSSDGTTLGKDVSNQMFQRPGTVIFSGILLILIGLLPGLPFPPFGSIGFLLCAFGAYLVRSSEGVSDVGLSSLPSERTAGTSTRLLDGPSRTRNERVSDNAIQLFLDSNVLFKLYTQQVDVHRNWWSRFRADFFESIGLLLPELEVLSDELLTGERYRIVSKGVKVAEGSVPLDSLFVNSHVETARVFGFDALRAETHPLTGGRGMWVANSQAAKEISSAAGIVGYDYFGFIALQIARHIVTHPEDVLTMSDVLLRMRDIEKSYPGLLSEGFDTEFLNISRLTVVLQELVRQQVSIRDFKSTIENLAGYCTAFGRTLVQEDDFDLQDIVSYVRMKRSRQIVEKFLNSNGVLRVLSVADEVEGLFDTLALQGEGVLRQVQRESDFRSLESGLSTVLEPVFSKGVVPVVVLCDESIRQKVGSFMRTIHNPLPVFGIQELDPLIRLEFIGKWGLQGVQ